MVRYFELSAALAMTSEIVFTSMTEKALKFVMANFFMFDLLTQYALLDFLYLFTKSPWTSKMVSPFMKQMFADPGLRDMIQPSMVVLASSVHAHDPALFSLFDGCFISLLDNLMKTNPSQGCSCMYYICRQKQSLVELVQKPGGVPILKNWLVCSKDKDTRSVFIDSLA